MTRRAILLVIILLLSTAALSAAAAPSHAEMTGESDYLLAGDGTSPLQDDQDPPPDEVDPDSQQLANALLSGISDLIDQIFGGQALDNPALNTPVEDAQVEENPMDEEQVEEAPLEETEAEQSPVAEVDPPLEEDQAQEEPDVEEISETRKQADELIAHAQETMQRRAAERAGQSPEEGDSETAEAAAVTLLQQAQQMLAQITGDETEERAEDETVIQQWMASKPDCNADPAPMVNWSGCNMSGIELDGANLEGAILIETNFSDALISNTDFTGAVMKMVNFSGAELDNVIMHNSTLTGADFTNALIIFVDLSYANASWANFDGAEVIVVRALYANFVDALMTNAFIAYNDFSYSDLTGVNFAGASPGFNFLRGSNLENVNLSFANSEVLDMTGAHIQGLDLSGAIMAGIWLKGATGQPAAGSADLQIVEYICPDGTYFDGQTTTDPLSLCDWDIAPPTPPAPPDTANCDADPAPGVNWSNCNKTSLVDVPGLDLRNANLQGTLFSGITMYMWDLSGADMSGAQLDVVNIDLSSLRDADLSGAVLNGASVIFSDLTAANLAQASLGTATTLAPVLPASVEASTLRQTDLSEANLASIVVFLADLTYANLTNSQAANLLLDFAFMRGVNLTGADLTGSLQSYVDMSAAQIEGVDLSFTTFEDRIRLKDANGLPIPGEDLYLLDGGTLICPAGEALVGPLTTSPQSLCTWIACWEGVMNGGFHGDEYWYFPATEYTAELSDEQFLSPDYSARTGIVDPDDNTFSFSSVRQKAILPAGSKKAVLSFYLYPQTDEPKNYLIPTSVEEAMSIKGASSAMGPNGSHIGDAQWVLILDSMGRELMRPITMRSNSQTWELHTVDLSKLVNPYKDVTIELYFGAFNNGYEGVTALYVDDVSLGNCSGIPQPQPPEPPPTVCSDIVTNGGFEVQDSSWMLPITPYPASYSDELYNMGDWSMRTGIDDPETNELSFSSAIQRVHIPADATAADLAFYLYPQSSEDYKMLIPESIETVLAPKAKSILYGDAQWVLILDKHGRELQRLVSTRSNEQSWRDYQFDLLPYKNQTILLYFGTFNNGFDGRTTMNVDDVTLNVCTPEVD